MRRPLLVALGFLVLFAAAWSLRAQSEVLVLQPDGVHFTAGGDPYYHMRRIAYSVERFPDVLDFDRYVNYPHGGHIVWPPAFDWSIAALARAVAPAGDETAVEHVAARVPAVLGALAVVGVAWVGRRRFSPGAGWLAGGLLAVLPVHLLHSQAGQLDHHVAVALGAVALTGVALASASRAGAPGLASAFGLGGLFAALLLLWPGALIHVGAFDGLLVLYALLAERAEDARARARWLALANAVAAVVLAPFGWGQAWPEFGPWSPWVLSNFQPAFFAVAAGVLGVAALAFGTGLGATRGRRIGAAVAAGVVALGAAFLVIPGLSDVVATGAGWFSKEEAFQHEVRELRPFALDLIVSRLTILAFLFPFAWAWLAWRSVRTGASADRFVLLGMSLLFFVLTSLQRRFGNSFSIFYVLVWGWLFYETAPLVAAAWRRWGTGRRIAAGAFAAVFLLLLADGLLALHLERWQGHARAHADPAVARGGPHGVRNRLVDAGSRWLGANSPPTSGWFDPEVLPEYAVLSSWDAGHMLRYRARRPLVQDNFGVYGGRENYDAAERYFAARDEAEAVAMLDALGVRYVMADRHGAGRTAAYPEGTLAHRLAFAFGTAWPADALAPAVPALSHHRLLWHQRSGRALEFAAEPPGFALGIWEIVAGARVVGFAAPGERVEASLVLRTAQGRRHRYRAVAEADGEGRYVFVLPYSTEATPGSAVQGEGDFTLVGARGGSGSLSIPERDVRAGSELAGPDLRRP